jgi:hypothetical protein
MMGTDILAMALRLKGIEGADVRIDAEAGAMLIEYTQRGRRVRAVLTFEDIETWCRENLPAMPAETPTEVPSE